MEEENITLQSLVNITTLYHEFDIASKLLQEKIQTSVCIGCGQCCENNTPIAYGVEAANAVSNLIGLGKLYEFQRRIEGWLLDRHKECTIYEPISFTQVKDGLDAKLKSEMLALSRTPCPLLENKRCLIYEFRPIPCRTYNVLYYGCTNRPPGKGETLTQRSIIRGEIVEELKQERDFILEHVPRTTWKHAGFYPTLIFAHAWPKEFEKMVADGKVASAKLAMTYPTMAVIFEEQVESLTDHDLFRKDSQKELARKEVS